MHWIQEAYTLEISNGRCSGTALSSQPGGTGFDPRGAPNPWRYVTKVEAVPSPRTRSWPKVVSLQCAELLLDVKYTSTERNFITMMYLEN